MNHSRAVVVSGWPSSTLLVGLLTVLLLASCTSDGRLTSPGGPDDDSTLVTMEVVAGVAEEDLELASSLGWTGGAISGAQIHVLRNGTATWRSGVADEHGVAQFEDLRPGLYRVYAERLLSEGEAETIGGTRRAWGDGETVQLSGSSTVTLAMGADEPGGLVISEIGIGSAPSWEVPPLASKDGLFLEVYNNGPSTVHLDGVLLSSVFFIGRYETAVSSCELSQSLRSDDQGLYAHYALQFPGAGSEFPIHPGEAKVVAVLAQDLRQIHESMPDLSGAAFEIVPEGKGDNPAVPNMIDVGFEPFDSSLLIGQGFYFLARPMDFRSLPILHRDFANREFVRVPAEDLLDVTPFAYLWPEMDAEHPPCVPMVHESFARYEGGFFEIGMGMDTGASAQRSLVRRVVREGAFGPVLMRTRASAVDFLLGKKTPGWIE